MQLSRIAELLMPFVKAKALSASRKACHSEPERSGGEEPALLSPTLLQSISRYIDLLLRWNARINLTAIRNPEEIVTRHFGESLFAARQLFQSRSTVGTAAPREPALSKRSAPKGPAERSSVVRLADIGSGAGFPGIPIKLWQPNLYLTLIESTHKKAAFLREVIRTLGLTNAEVVTHRSETITGPRFDLVTLRAVERMEEVLPAAARLLNPNGRLALFLSSRQADAARSSLSLRWRPEIPIPQSDARILLIGANLQS